EKQPIKTYNFAKFTSGIAEGETKKAKKTSLKSVHFSDDEFETDPIKIDTSNTNFLLDNDDEITYTLKKNKKDNYNLVILIFLLLHFSFYIFHLLGQIHINFYLIFLYFVLNQL